MPNTSALSPSTTSAHASSLSSAKPASPWTRSNYAGLLPSFASASSCFAMSSPSRTFSSSTSYRPTIPPNLSRKRETLPWPGASWTVHARSSQKPNSTTTRWIKPSVPLHKTWESRLDRCSSLFEWLSVAARTPHRYSKRWKSWEKKLALSDLGTPGKSSVELFLNRSARQRPVSSGLSAFKKASYHRPVLLHHEFCFDVASPCQQFQPHARLSGESLDRPPWNVGIVFGMKHHDL